MDLLNKVMLVGNLVRDPEVRETGNGKAVANFCLAVDPPGGGMSRDDRNTSAADPIFVDIVVWERNAENASQYLQKGSQVLIEGRLQMDSWKDKESGQARSKLKVCGERMRFMATPGGGDGQRRDSRQRRPEPAGAR
ncbi:MAG: single-stranded DNA-binding protein [Akkermansiaceae bacterium]|nr:single-stranded DNA-binding protein [Akkermansiaceae bacterium]NNM30525.1 single-stranded DNA-binding protein [Akkermansiaceae bacterium]